MTRHTLPKRIISAQVTAKNAELLRLNRDNGRLLEQATHLQQALAGAEREQHHARTELESLRPLPAQVAKLERRAAELASTAEELRTRDAESKQQLDAARPELRDSELDRTPILVRLEGIQATWAQRELQVPDAELP